MLEADQIVDLLTVAGALALVAVPIMALMLVWAIRTAWRLMCNLRDEETEHAWTRRRLEDVEAIRAKDRVAKSLHDGECALPPEGWRCTRKPSHDGPCATVLDHDLIRTHLGDPPYSDEERATDRAYADAGIMLMGEYVAKHGGSDATHQD